MSSNQNAEITDVLQRVQAWPVVMRMALARQILQSTETSTTEDGPPKQRGVSAQELRQISKRVGTPPDDATVKRWLHEHRMEKYGP